MHLPRILHGGSDHGDCRSVQKAGIYPLWTSALFPAVQIGLLAERHPHVPTVMIHMGHGHGVYIEGSLNMAYKYDNLFLEVSGMPMGCQIKNAYDTVGSERVDVWY